MPPYKIGDSYYSVSSSSLEISNEEYTIVRLIPFRAIVEIEYLKDVRITLTLVTKEVVRIGFEEVDGKVLDRLYVRLQRLLS